MITEEVKKEADSVCEKYYLINKVVIDKATDAYLSRMMSVHCAIQDRQSVLEELNNYASKVTTNGTIYEKYYENRLLNLTQQIEYLKSKI